MKSDESQAPKTENNVPVAKNTTSHYNPASKSEPLTQVQADSVITREDMPNLGFRITVTAIAIGIILFIIGTYYGIINV
ncbi:hypothetical protein [Gloeocapsopsis dulcis]|uniref:Uncharacterized protein n=1 Tax=Gloeocapsopsis dulcis AAB1 = 1H9 TaxID=1433147 RepID=A0A6N8FSJ9_9CHRO|nr:hypothetical protein [Gloeocapsopsis dulcis]MUL35734.1 hypothetical protein [Gloeocapsopsis dulcis AAB1 = 1H9]WNN90983.1 hypothetical protein P0S91_07885 [Gloeocapsopsis dulcis]